MQRIPTTSTTLTIGLYVACELIANATANTTITVGKNLNVSGGVFIHALAFTLLDLANERSGKQGARRMIYVALAANLLLVGYMLLLGVLTREPSSAWNGVPPGLAATHCVMVASLAAFPVASLVDVQVFAWWRKRIGGPAWARVLASNTVSTLVDSVVFITLAFGFTAPATRPSIPILIAGQYAVKMAVTTIGLPLIYVVRSGTDNTRDVQGDSSRTKIRDVPDRTPASGAFRDTLTGIVSLGCLISMMVFSLVVVGSMFMEEALQILLGMVFLVLVAIPVLFFFLKKERDTRRRSVDTALFQQALKVILNPLRECLAFSEHAWCKHREVAGYLRRYSVDGPAIYRRAAALLRLQASHPGPFERWILADEDVSYIHPAMLDTAATAPLTGEKEYVFKSQDFFRQVQEMADREYEDLQNKGAIT